MVQVLKVTPLEVLWVRCEEIYRSLVTREGNKGKRQVTFVTKSDKIALALANLGQADLNIIADKVLDAAKNMTGLAYIETTHNNQRWLASVHETELSIYVVHVS